MRAPGRFAALVELLDTIRGEWHEKGRSADRIVSDYTRSRRFIGSKDRRWITENLYFAIRNYRLLVWQLADEGLAATPVALCLIAIRHAGEMPQSVFDPADSHSLEKPDEFDVVNEINVPGRPDDADILYNMPAELGSLLKERYGTDYDSLAKSLQQPAGLDIRVRREKAGALLLPEAESWQHSQFAPFGMRRLKSLALQTEKAYRDGDYEIQDEASQICAALVGARAGHHVLDLCAGAGGKSLAIADYIEGAISITTSDISDKRLKELNKRFSKIEKEVDIYRLDLKKLAAVDYAPLDHLRNSQDRVLVDAPCSSAGTWRRNPALRWHYSPGDIADFASLQRTILDEGARFVKVGGWLIYATCSLFEEENDSVVAAFLDSHRDFQIVDYREIWTDCGLKGEPTPSLASDKRMLQLAPHLHETDGFFVCVLQKMT